MSSSIAWLSSREIQDQLAANQIGALDVARATLDRIRRLNPRLHAYVYVDEDATGGDGALRGVPIAVKDTQPVAGMPWTAGSPRWRDRVAAGDSITVRRMREAGAVVLGKTNTPELAAAIGTTNDIFPPTENPWRPGYTPGGSSGGSGTAVAAGLATIALGDDMGGSIRIPAAANGVIGLRPTPGRVPADIPDPTHLTTSGPLARTVDDARRAFSILSGEAPEDVPQRPRRVGVIKLSRFGVADACAAACERAAAALAAAGHDVRTLDCSMPAVADEYIVIRPVSMGVVPGDVREYGSAVRDSITEGRSTSAIDLYLAMERGVTKARQLNVLVEGEFDALLTPTLGSMPMPIPQVPVFLSDSWKRYTGFVLPVSFSGLPAVSVPAGLSVGLPVAVQLVGRRAGELELLSLAEDLEAMPGFGYQRPPNMS